LHLQSISHVEVMLEDLLAPRRGRVESEFAHQLPKGKTILNLPTLREFARTDRLALRVQADEFPR
jgi:hypothetical protein